MTDLMTRIEEHVIALQDQDVASGRDAHYETIALLREAKEEIRDAEVEHLTCSECGEDLDSCSSCRGKAL